VESVVEIDALRQPLYLFVMLTLVSFVLAGLREELWRSAMIALLAGLLPRWFAGRRGAWLAILPVALLFGLGHTPQGVAGVAVTTLLGAGLGAILVFHNSIWPAVLAHGFFNALTFAILPLLSDRFPELLR
jgi:membrane protease YdiL (CAAX protease family)